MALLTADERASLRRFNAVNEAVQVGQRLSDASTLQCMGDTATGHIRLVSNVQIGDSIAVFAGAACNRQAVFIPGSDITYEFSSTGSVTPGNLPVLLGATSAQSAINLAEIIARTQCTVVRAEAHPVDTNVVDIVHIVPGGVLTLTAQAANRIAVQSNNEGLAPADFVMIMRKRTISAEDVARGRIRFDTGWSKIVEGFASLYRSSTDQTAENFNGVVTYDSGKLELAQGTGTGQFLAGNVMHLMLLGMR